MFAVSLKGKEGPDLQIPYMESWGFLQKYRPYRCYLCPDGTSEFADLSCGDPWYREIQESDPGYSLVLARTERGQKIIHAAIEAGYVTLEPADPGIVGNSQRNLLSKRRGIWGRLFALKMFGIPVPRYPDFALYENWKQLLPGEKVRSILGTIRRIIQRKYYKPVNSKNEGSKKLNGD
jgi:coenzyme F420 hydrogenase subunit beta